MPVNTRPGPAEAPCALCGRVRPLSFHHLIPRTLHRNKWFRKNFDAMDMRSRGIELCKECHEFIHQRYGQKELGRRLNTLAALAADPAVRSFVAWIRKR